MGQVAIGHLFVYVADMCHTADYTIHLSLQLQNTYKYILTYVCMLLLL